MLLPRQNSSNKSKNQNLPEIYFQSQLPIMQEDQVILDFK